MSPSFAFSPLRNPRSPKQSVMMVLNGLKRIRSPTKTPNVSRTAPQLAKKTRRKNPKIAALRKAVARSRPVKGRNLLQLKLLAESPPFHLARSRPQPRRFVIKPRRQR